MRKIDGAERIGHRDRAMDGIIALVATGDLPLDELISETRIAQKLGVSRTPVREAVAVYAAEGIISQIPQTGLLINRVSDEEVGKALGVRYLCELAAVAKITSNESLEPRNLRAFRASMSDAFRRQSRGEMTTDEALQLNASLHEAISADIGSLMFEHIKTLTSTKHRIFHAEHPLEQSELGAMLEADTHFAEELLSAPSADAGRFAHLQNHSAHLVLLHT